MMAQIHGKDHGGLATVRVCDRIGDLVTSSTRQEYQMLTINFAPDTRTDLCKLARDGRPHVAQLVLDLRTERVTVRTLHPDLVGPGAGVAIEEYQGLVQAHRLPKGVDALALAEQLEDEASPLRVALAAVLDACDQIAHDERGNPCVLWTIDHDALDDLEQAVTRACEALSLAGELVDAEVWFEPAGRDRYRPSDYTGERVLRTELDRVGVTDEDLGPVDGIVCAVKEGIAHVADDGASVEAPAHVALAALADLPDAAGWTSTWEALRDLGPGSVGLTATTTDAELAALAQLFEVEGEDQGYVVLGVLEHLQAERDRLAGNEHETL